MKKIMLSFCVTALSINCFGQSTSGGQLKITIESFKCLIKSWDGVVEFDGHGNEASATYSYRIYNPSNPSAARSGMNGTSIFGSNINGMTRAGTQTPDLGGIQAGDVVPVGMLVMSEHINADDYIIIAPTIWEWDGPRTSTFSSFNAQLENDLNWAMNQPFPYASTTINLQDPYGSRVTKIFDKYSYGQATKYHNIFQSFMCPGVGQGNKPVDLRSGTFNNQCMVIYPPTLLLLDTRVLMAVYNHNKNVSEINHPERPGRISNLVEIKFTENTYAVQANNGAYSMLLKIEFTPDVVIAPSKTVFTRPKVETLRQDPQQVSAKVASSASAIIGKWSGTQTNDDGLYPNPISFELTGNGEFIMADSRSGLVSARGVYNYADYTITGSYKMLSSGETIAFAGTYDPFKKQITCSLGMGNPPKGQGRWNVIKQSL
ncbi:MAG TPA: hypothetical protein VF476_14905 [Chitinophagaceae bacterium]